MSVDDSSGRGDGVGKQDSTPKRGVITAEQHASFARHNESSLAR